MQRPWGVWLAVSLVLAGCQFPGTQTVQGSLLDATDRDALSAAFKDILSTQQARQQVKLMESSLIADNSQGLISNNGSGLIRNQPLVAHNTAGIISNAGSTYRVAATRPQTPNQHYTLPDGSHFYRIGSPTLKDTLVETFITRVPSVVSSGFDVPDGEILMHAKMIVNLEDFDVEDYDKPVTNSYHIEVVKSPVFTDFRSTIQITAPPLGQTLQYLSTATYMLGDLPVTASATHSAFTSFTVDGVSMDLPTVGAERIRLGKTVLDLSYQNVSGQGVGSGTWKTAAGEVWPLTYTYDFNRNRAEMRITLPEERKLILEVQPGMQVMAGKAVNAAGETLATLAKREDGAVVLHFSQGGETVLFE